MKNYLKTISILVTLLALIVLSIVLIYQPKKFNCDENKYTKSLCLGSEWFLNNQDESFVHYEYDYNERSYTNGTGELREMASLWSVARLSNFLKDKRYGVLAQKGFSHFEDYFEYDKENDFYFANMTQTEPHIGHPAFIILTLLEIDHPKKEEYLKKFANGIIYMQNEYGELVTFFYSYRNTGQDYYPGEALVALMSLYEYTKEEEYLIAVKNAFPYYVDYFRGNPNTAFVPWQSRAYHKLYKATKNKSVADFIFEMNDFILDKNYPQEECSNFYFLRGIPTAVFMEGVTKAYDIAKELGDEKRTQCYLNFIKEGSDYVVSLQVNESDQKVAIGGFLGREISQIIRVDNNQHAVMALMDAYNLGIVKE